MTDDIGHTSDADRVEEIREGLTLKYERMRDGGRLRVVRGDISLADARFLLAQYDALKAENGKLREALHLLVVCIVERNPSHVQASMLGNAIDTACKALGKPWGFWREGGR